MNANPLNLLINSSVFSPLVLRVKAPELRIGLEHKAVNSFSRMFSRSKIDMPRALPD
jgi:hypothetical protein